MKKSLITKILMIVVGVVMVLGILTACASEIKFPDTIKIDGIPGSTSDNSSTNNPNSSSDSNSSNTNNNYHYYGEEGELKPIKNVIMMVPDGMSVSATTLARYMLPNNEDGSQNLYIDEHVKGLMRTTWAGGPITDSAPAGSAFATGHKSNSGVVGLDASSLPKATVLEAAKTIGKSTGVIATSEFMHATPAAFTSHEYRRGNYEIVARQMANLGLNVYFGSGSAKITTTSFTNYITAEGYNLVETRTAMNALSKPSQSGTVSDTLKQWGDFSSNMGKNNLSFDIDRVAEEPSLADMTKKAIELLSADSDGFFLMVEGSKVDWAAHDNDTVGIVSDVLAFDKAFRTAVEFAKQDKDTLVFSVSDHGNSGITIGSGELTAGNAGYGYDSAPFDILKPLKNASLTAEGALMLLSGNNHDDVLQAYGVDVSKYTESSTGNNLKVYEKIEAFKASPSKATLEQVMNQICYIGYSTGGHSAEDINFYMYAPKGYTVESLLDKNGFIDNTDVAKLLANAMNVDLDRVTDDLFVAIYSNGESLLPFNYSIELVSAQIGGGCIYEAIFTVTRGTKTITVKSNDNEFTVGSTTVKLDFGVVIYNLTASHSAQNQESGTLYVPAAVLEALF